ncbi:MAG: Arylsulfatase A [Promethearchaeota archaeon]|nr:MAG: Arylsulfatase A [Candidatus Lokiarchaeota archaeon]
MSNKPNIIFLLNDHQAYYGHEERENCPAIQRPNFHKLAKSGVDFTQAYTACPLCGPTRRTFLTGLYPHNHLELLNEVNHPYDTATYLDKLKESGYDCYYYGKWHAGPGTALTEFNCEGYSMPGYGNPYTTPEYKKYLKEFNLPPFEVSIVHSFLDPSWPKAMQLGIKEGASHRPSDPTLLSEHATGIMTSPKETHEAFFLAHLACTKLVDISNQANRKPFHLRVDFWGPHQPYYVPQEYRDRYDAEQILEYPNFNDNLNNKPEIYKYDINYPISEKGKIKYPNPLPWSFWREVLAFHYAHISLIDDAGGIILNKLQELGLDKNTIIIWTTDHGDAVASHGGHFDKDCYLSQEMIRVPLAISYPEEIPPNQKNSSLVNSIDIAPTILDAAGLSFETPIDGRSLIPLMKNPDSTWRQDVMIETHGHVHLHLGRTVIKDNYKYTYNERFMDELYDLANDPYELNNLIEAEAYREILEEMKEILEKWREQTNDSMTKRMIRKKTR